MIYEVEGGFVISAYQVWIPGRYATRRAAKFAFRLTPDQQSELNQEVCVGEQRAITWEDVKAKRASTRASTQKKAPRPLL